MLTEILQILRQRLSRLFYPLTDPQTTCIVGLSVHKDSGSGPSTPVSLSSKNLRSKTKLLELMLFPLVVILVSDGAQSFCAC